MSFAALRVAREMCSVQVNKDWAWTTTLRNHVRGLDSGPKVLKYHLPVWQHAACRLDIDMILLTHREEIFLL